ncbi:PREDICTED: protein phosphatase 1 regulatory subunit 32 [Calidris pugnax]|uniref:protein phosphatase 1 regulatory subunit 32 n=1 Tax=Calidris pugnax TaxID=198806 RepID=UPI00071D5B28|nr:PREDICTED: protein phosphatase 1 regulatory subunit 32 [Calidris pugnax]
MEFISPHAKLRSLPRGLPAVGLGTKGRADLMNFYATTYAVAHAQPRVQPFLGHHIVTGYVPNNDSAVPCLLRAAEGHQQEATSTTTEHFKPFLLLDGRSLLPGQVHQTESGYFQVSPLSWLNIGVGSHQGPPQAPKDHGTSPEILQKMTIGTMEQSGFSRATRRTDSLLPTLPGQPGDKGRGKGGDKARPSPP